MHVDGGTIADGGEVVESCHFIKEVFVSRCSRWVFGRGRRISNQPLSVGVFYQKIQKDISDSKEILADAESDEDLKELAGLELIELEESEKNLHHQD